MKLHTVCATCFLPDLVADLAGKNPYEKVIIFCEDKFSLSLELALAKKYGADAEKAEIAGILHDITKEYKTD